MKELKLSLLQAAIKRCKNTTTLYIKKIDSGFEVPGKDKSYFEQLLEKLNAIEGEINE